MYLKRQSHKSIIIIIVIIIIIINQGSLGSGHLSNRSIFAVPSNAVFCTCPGLTLTCIYIIRIEETQPTQNAV